MRRSGSARTPSSSSSDHSLSQPRRPKKRARGADANAASLVRGSNLWRESRGANGQFVLSLESDDDDDARGADADSLPIRLLPTKRSGTQSMSPAIVTPRARETTTAAATTSPVVYTIDSDSDADSNDDDDVEIVEVVERVSPSEEVDVAAVYDSEQENNSGEVEKEEGEEEWKPAEDMDETHESEEMDHDEDGDEEDDSGEEDKDADDMEVTVRPRRSTLSDVAAIPHDANDADAIPIQQETLTPVKAELVVEATTRTAERILTPTLSPSPTPTALDPVPVPAKDEPPAEEEHGPLVSFSQIQHESPPVRKRHHHHRHPRAARRSTVRRRRLDPDHAGMVLFDGPQYAPSAGVVKNLIEFITRTVGPMTGRDRRWVDYILLAKLNDCVSRLSTEVFTRHSEWMKITLGTSDDTRRDKHRVQREPLLALPIRYTVRPSHVIMPKASPNGKTKAKNSTAAQKQKAVDTKWLEKRASELQGGQKRSKSETPRRLVSVGIPSKTNGGGPFSPTSSITSSVASRARRALRGDVFAPAYKRARVAEASPLSNGVYSPSTASTITAASPWPSADFEELANDETTTGGNRSMPNDWDPSDARAAPASLRPAAMNPLFTMPLSELKAHINSVRREGHARSFERPLEILHKLMHHPRNRDTFNSPVDPVALNLPTYLDVIKEPMDLGTIKIRLEEAAYVEQDDFVSDVRLVFENAMRFNAPNHSVHVDASVLLTLFEDLLHGDKRHRPLNRRTPTASSDRHACRGCLGRSCVMCDQGCLEFSQPHLVCAGSCGVDIRKGSIYYITRDGTRVWCAKCRTRHVRTESDVVNDGPQSGETHVDDHAQGTKTKKKKPRRVSTTAGKKESDTGIDTIHIPGELMKKKCELDVEPWVKCSRCVRWLHQVCGLYNPVYDAYATEHEYQCPLCVWKLRAPTPPLSALSKAETVSLPNDAKEVPTQQYESSCHQIPTCELSTFIEEYLHRGLRDMGEFQAAENLHVRVLAFPHERVVVSDRLVNAFNDNALLLDHVNATDDRPPLRFPSEIAYTSRGIYLFQRHDGADVALFTLFVQEYGDDCQLEANRRSVYVAYLDSIRYLTPPSARTASYHLIMMAYFDFIRRNGFERVHIWSCPPQKRISYVFWCRPSFQKTPSAEHLRAWYRRLLTKSQHAGIVKSWTTTYDQYFSKAVVAATTVAAGTSPTAAATADGSATVATRGTTAKSINPAEHVWPVARLPPLFDGDFLPAELERILGRLAARNGKHRRGSGSSIGSSNSMNGGKSSSVGSTGGKLAVGESVACIKEEKRAAAAMPQVEFKVREIFDRCQHAVQRLRNDLLVVDLVVIPKSPLSSSSSSLSTTMSLPPHVPPWWHHVPRLFGSRFMFHQLCSSATYQFDSLRRAKHSTMMLLHHFKNESVRQLNVFCSECYFLITHAEFWHCRCCVRFALCDLCHHRDGSSHPHALVFGGGLGEAAATSATAVSGTVDVQN